MPSISLGEFNHVVSLREPLFGMNTPNTGGKSLAKASTCVRLCYDQYTWRPEDGKRQEAGLASPGPRAALGEAGGRPLALDT